MYTRHCEAKSPKPSVLYARAQGTCISTTFLQRFSIVTIIYCGYISGKQLVLLRHEIVNILVLGNINVLLGSTVDDNMFTYASHVLCMLGKQSA